MHRTVGIVSRPRQEEIASVAPKLIEWLEGRGLTVLYDRETGSCLSKAGRERSREDLASAVDLLIVLGGDGTLLSAARSLGDHPVPILPVNLGGLGFLTSVTLAELYPILEEVLSGRSRVSERTQLDTKVLRVGKVVARHRALNDVVLNKGALARIIDLKLHVDGDYVSSYKADGLILSTPTGSTAYSLAAGGPIVYPKVAAFIVTPICPHTLTNRPLVIPDTSQVEISFRAGDEPVFLTLDGQVGVELEHADKISVAKAAQPLRLVRPARKTYFEILRNKLKWGER
ncbi:MAG TPA: NAD(+)/NADH kinase [Candidatus Acidoferrales bacterium]|jgi:NAD+ kinase|nr:NAD(+)/NADH kinase [Candidatus Acidoferrales bacterium]